MVYIRKGGITYLLAKTVHTPSNNEYTISVYDITNCMMDDEQDARNIICQYHVEGPHAMLEALVQFLSLLFEYDA